MPKPKFKTLTRARALRHDSTFPERLLWSKLRRRQLFGLRFKRQQPMGPYILDFLCPTHRLVIEVDGMTHVGRASADADERRTRDLTRWGLRVIRVTNDDVLENLDGVLHHIAREAGVEL